MSVSLTVDVTVSAGIALVTAHVRNPTPTARQVRVENRIDGPVLPPRRDGVPASGWDDDGVTVVVDAEDTVALGYACPTGEHEPEDPPAELADVGDPDGHVDDAVARTRRELGEFRPPRDAVPLDGSPPVIDGHPITVGDSERRGSNECGSEPSGESPTENVIDEATTEEFPDGVDEYLARVAERVAVAEQLTDASVSEATAVLENCTADVPDLSDLPDRLGDDAETLLLLAECAETLAARAEATDVPVAALVRLA